MLVLCYVMLCYVMLCYVMLHVCNDVTTEQLSDGTVHKFKKYF